MVTEIEVGKWYKIKNKIVYVTRYDFQSYYGRLTVYGIEPKHYAAFVVQNYLGEKEPTFRTIAEIEKISPPPLTIVKFTTRSKIIHLNEDWEVIK